MSVPLSWESIKANVKPECQQLNSSSASVSSQEAWWVSLGLFPSWMHNFHIRHPRLADAERTCSSGKTLLVIGNGDWTLRYLGAGAH
jgi:hypothetical protein